MDKKSTRSVKTYSGCWTCRARKVKCDLVRPSCLRCRRSKVQCGGYKIKLRWSPLLHFDLYGVPMPSNESITTTEGDDVETSTNLRRNVERVRYEEEYEYHEDMDEELSELHAPPEDKIANNKTWIIKKFGVFRAIEREAIIAAKRGKTDKRPVQKKIANELNSNNSNNHINNEPLMKKPRLAPSVATSTMTTPISLSPTSPMMISDTLGLTFDGNPAFMSPLPMELLQPDFIHDHSHLVSLSTESCSIVHNNVRFLLTHYLEKVPDLMTIAPIPNKNKNPWAKIYFPRAIAALGELIAFPNSKNYARISLLNGCLSVSCFNLKDLLKYDPVSTDFYLNLAVELRTRASHFLNLALEQEEEYEEYRDILEDDDIAEDYNKHFCDMLIAILTMNSIDIVWGTMVDCDNYLRICEQLISKNKKRVVVSKKIKSLYTIYAFLKLMQNSTAMETITSEPSLDFHNPEIIPYKYLRETYENDIKTIFTDHYGSTKMNTLGADALNALPNSLVLLFYDCVSLTRYYFYHKKKSEGIELPTEFFMKTREFEDKLSNWKSEWDFFDSTGRNFLSPTIEGIYHHTMSFYYGLCVYYYNFIKNQDYESLNVEVWKVIYHLQQIEFLKDSSAGKEGIKLIPLIWQGFIAGCLCSDPEVQSEFKTWFDTVSLTGAGSYRGAIQIMFEVWRRRDNNELGDDWLSVSRDWEMNIMLT